MGTIKAYARDIQGVLTQDNFILYLLGDPM
jgi:hypothetical protein